MPNEIIRFEDFELDRGAFELRRAGRVVRLERIPLELLFLLAGRRGQLVPREEILERIWGKDVFVDADNSINTAVRKIRLALKDNTDEPRFVQTVPGKGYRFAAEVFAKAQAEEAAKPRTNEEEVTTAKKLSPANIWLIGLGAVVLLGVLAVVMRPHWQHIAKPASGKTMLAVLPFVNLTGNPQEEYFADGMTEEMITQLGGLDPAHLGVIARTSSMQYKNAKKGVPQIAKELGVNYLLEGSVREDESRVRVTAQLIQAKDATHIWAGNFDGELKDVLRLQSEVALNIAEKIELNLEGPVRARLGGTPAVNPEAHEAYLRGLYASDLRTKEGTQQAIAELQRAINVDASYAAAYAALARVYSLASVTGALSAQDSMPKAQQAASRAIALDDSLAEGHTVMGFVKAHYEYDWPGAEHEYLRGLELNPSDPYAHFFYSNSYLSPLGRHEEAIAEMDKAAALDPFSPPIQSFRGRTLLWARRYDEAMERFNKCADMFPGLAINRERMAHLATYMCKYDMAISDETKARLLNGEDPVSVEKKEGELRMALKNRGAQGYWQMTLELSKSPDNPPEAYLGSYGLAIIYARLGEKQKALDALDRAFDEHALAMTEIG
ncbi:MAG: winged helix-turn-helix domain-containing protein, partial [Terriglobales bacterium]